APTSGASARRGCRCRLPPQRAQQPAEALFETDLRLPAEQLFRPGDVRAALLRVVDRQRLEDDLAARPRQALDRLRQLEQRALLGVADVDGQVLVALREQHDAADQVVDVAEAARLRAVAVDRERLARERL